MLISCFWHRERASGICHKPSSRLPLLSVRLASWLVCVTTCTDLYCLVKRGICVWMTCLKSLHDNRTAVIEPASSRLLVQCFTYCVTTRGLSLQKYLHTMTTDKNSVAENSFVQSSDLCGVVAVWLTDHQLLWWHTLMILWARKVHHTRFTLSARREVLPPMSMLMSKFCTICLNASSLGCCRSCIHSVHPVC